MIARRLRPLPLIPMLALLAAGPLALPQMHSSSLAAAETNGDKASQKAEATRLNDEGVAALKLVDSDPSKVVDAAIAFNKALKLVNAIGADELRQEVQANMWYAKKKMSDKDLDRFLESKGANKTEAKLALSQVNLTAKAAIPASEAKEYLARAERFARANPAKHYEIAIRYLEVAERFTGTPESVSAQKLSLEASEAYNKDAAYRLAKANEDLQKNKDKLVEEAMKQANENKRNTIFSQVPAAGKGAMPVPAKTDVDRLIAEYRGNNAVDYRQQDPTKRWALAEKVLKQAKETKGDPAMRWALAKEALDVARVPRVDAIHVAIDAAIICGEDYLGQDPRAVRIEHLRSMNTNPAQKAALALMDDPLNAQANTDLGYFYAVRAKRHTDGFNMLAMGKDPDLKRIGEMELAKPRNGDESFQLATLWDGVANRESDRVTKLAVLARAFQWYKEACKQLKGGGNLDRAKARATAIENELPLENPDWDDLTGGQWNRLKGPVLEVEAARTFKQPFAVPPGQRIRVVPHPDDRWVYAGRQVDWKGLAGNGGIFMQLDEGARLAPGEIVGPVKKVSLGQDISYWQGGEMSGRIRVKLVLLQQ
jgi:hypothetical protein